MSLEANKALVRRFVEEMQNQHDLEALDVFLSPSFYDHTGASDLEGTRQLFTMMFTAFPDMHFTIRQQVAEGDKVLTHKTFSGTHLGPFMGMPPSGKSVSIDVMDLFTVKDGLLVEHWNVSDMLGMLQQLEAFPAPQPA